MITEVFFLLQFSKNFKSLKNIGKFNLLLYKMPIAYLLSYLIS